MKFALTLLVVVVSSCACGVLFAAPAPAVTDDAVEMVLSVDDNGTRFAWELKYGQARQVALESLAKGEKDKALQAARMQFILCPPDAKSVETAIKSVKQMLVALDGGDARALQFEAFASLGPAGPDLTFGTEDDLSDPLKDLPLNIFARDKQYFVQFDKMIDERASVSATWEKGWYETEKAFARLDAGDFDGAVDILVATLAAEIKLPFAQNDEDWELQKIQDIIDRLTAGLNVVYRARNGTIAGAARFVQECMDFARFGPPGQDNQMGTADDLQPPL